MPDALYDAAEFRRHEGEKNLEVGCGTGAIFSSSPSTEPWLKGVDLTAKYQCAQFQFLAPWFGWFLVVRGQKN
jgi:ubiquinone/menaquinone biosynthesis C-methylase UbiE